MHLNLVFREAGSMSDDLEKRLRTELCISVQLATKAADRIAELEKALRNMLAHERLRYGTNNAAVAFFKRNYAAELAALEGKVSA